MYKIKLTKKTHLFSYRCTWVHTDRKNRYTQSMPSAHKLRIITFTEQTSN